MELGKFSFGMGDRFGHQALAQLKAIDKARKCGIEITPVWNKSNREHTIIHTTPADTWKAVSEVIKSFGWTSPFFVDADHINLSNVDKFIDRSTFFTLDVADYIGKEADKGKIADFVSSNIKYCDKAILLADNITVSLTIPELEAVSAKYLFAVMEAGKIYRHIEERKGAGNFITEVSMDEVDIPQSPVELFFILNMLAHEGVPVQTIAPRFSGRFNKGVDYEGNVLAFDKEFELFLLVIELAIKEFNLNENLKLSVHSGSDKFSIYPIIKKHLKNYNKGIHIKTAGTTWLEEVIGMALAGDEAFKLAKTIYTESLSRMDELCSPYASVINIVKTKLPTKKEVNLWSSYKFVNTLRHIPTHPDYNPDFRQLIHVGYKIAVEHINAYYNFLEEYPDIIGQQVYENIYERHLCRLFECC